MDTTTLQSRIKANVVIDENGCWVWQAGGRGEGYGAISIGGKVVNAHRAAYIAFHGPIPAGLDVLHECDNRPCCNPDHLVVGTRQKNNRDAIDRGRAVPFQPKRGRPLTAEEKESIRIEAANGTKLLHIAKRFDVSPNAVRRALKRQGATT